MVALFKERSPITVIWLLMLSIAVHAHFFISPPQVIAVADDGLISRLLRHYFAGGQSVLIMLLYHEFFSLEDIKVVLRKESICFE